MEGVLQTRDTGWKIPRLKKKKKKKLTQKKARSSVTDKKGKANSLCS